METREDIRPRNSFSLSRPYPVTLDIEKMGQVWLLGMALAAISMSELSIMMLTYLPACLDSIIFVKVVIVSSKTYFGAISTLVTTIKTGIPKAREIPRCSRVMRLTPMFAPTTIIE